ACPVARFAASGDLFTAPAAGTTFSLGGGLAGKRFLSEEARGEDVLVGEGRVGATVALGARTTLGLQAAYYEIFQRAEAVEAARCWARAWPCTSTTRTASARACAGWWATCAGCSCCPRRSRWPRGWRWWPPPTPTRCRWDTIPSPTASCRSSRRTAAPCASSW